ncbi:MAG: DUF4325 domain-containing protein [Alkalinema sp. CAN_BIN05]|nr:DUF4325 domain-containing protein [Alkalinema sp. CAN_BIN05]
MSKIRERGEDIRQFILMQVNNHSTDIVALVIKEFGITRQSVNKHIKVLVEKKSLITKGNTRNKSYHLHPLASWIKKYSLANKLEEDRVWDIDIKSLISDLPSNVKDIWYYAFTEMVNNAIDHSSGQEMIISVTRTEAETEILISDNGEGIFKKIQRELELHDESHAVLELAKGKLTTDPARHSGQGIFFTSRMFDRFVIISGNTIFSHEFDKVEDFIVEPTVPHAATTILMKLTNNTLRTSKQIFDQYSSGDDYAFTKTVVPVRLAQYGDEKLVSRSQAKRLLVRVDRFKKVILDFSGVEIIGQAFADEVFRVFRNQHPEIELISIHETQDVRQMIRRAETHSIG